MPRDVGDRVTASDSTMQFCQRLVLRDLKRVALEAFEFDAYGVVIAVAAPTVLGCPGVPRTVITADKLPDLPGTPDKKMGRNLQPFNLLEVGMLSPIQLVGEQFLHCVTAVNAWWQTDGMQDKQVNQCMRRSGAEVG